MKLSEFKQLIKQSILEEKEKEKNASGVMTPEEEKMVADYEREQDAKHALDKEQPLEEISGDVKKLKSFLKNYVNNEIQDPNSPYVHIEWFSESNMKARNLEQLLKSLDVEYKYETETDGGFKVHMFDINREQVNAAIRGNALDTNTNSDSEELMEEAMVSPDNRVAYLVNALGHVWNMGKGNNTIDFKSLAQSLINDMFDEETTEEDVIAEAERIVTEWNSKKQLTEEMHGGYLELLEMNPAFDEGVAKVLEAWNEWKEGDMTEPYMVEEAKQDILAYLSSIMK